MLMMDMYLPKFYIYLGTVVPDSFNLLQPGVAYLYSLKISENL